MIPEVSNPEMIIAGALAQSNDKNPKLTDLVLPGQESILATALAFEQATNAQKGISM